MTSVPSSSMPSVPLATPIGEGPRAPQHTLILPWPPPAREAGVIHRTSPLPNRSSGPISRPACRSRCDTARDLPPVHGGPADNNPHRRLGSSDLVQHVFGLPARPPPPTANPTAHAPRRQAKNALRYATVRSIPLPRAEKRNGFEAGGFANVAAAENGIHPARRLPSKSRDAAKSLDGQCVDRWGRRFG